VSLRIASVISLLCPALICAMISNCGCSSPAFRGTPSDVIGNWQSTVSTSSGSVLFIGGIDAQGKSLFFATDNNAFVGDTWELPTITAASSFSGTSTLYASLGAQLPSGGASQTVSSRGTVVSGNSITLTNSNGSFTFIPATPLTGPVKAFSGPMTGILNDGTDDGPFWGLVFTQASSGGSQSMSFTTSGPATCSVAGTFTQVGTSNIFDVSLTFSGGPDCSVPTGTPSIGLGFESDTDYFNANSGQAGTYLYADVLTSSGGAFVFEIY